MEAPNARSEIVPVADVIAAVPEGPAAILRGTARGLEVVVDATATVEAITTAMMSRLDEAPGFFRGSDVRIRVEDGPLPAGCLARLDEVASMFELRIVEVTAAKPRAATGSEAVPEPNLAAGSTRSSTPGDAAPAAAPEPEPAAPVVETRACQPVPVETSARIPVPAPAASAPAPVTEVSGRTAASQPVVAPPAPEAPANDTRVVVGPVRSGVILEHVGHLFIFGDVNPGAEVRATGNIVVLGRLRGTAHAGIGQEAGFIMALRLEPQQLRIGRKVARAADSDKPASEPEIAYTIGDHVIVEPYLGKLPRNLATSI